MASLNSCCCCISLKTGGLIIAYLKLLISIPSVPYNVLLLNEILTDGSLFRVLFPIFSIFLVFGIHKEDPGLMLPSLIMILSTSILFIILPIVTLTAYFDDIMEYISEMVDENTFDGITVLSVVLTVIYVSAALLLYFWFVLYSLYNSFKRNSHTGV